MTIPKRNGGTVLLKANVLRVLLRANWRLYGAPFKWNEGNNTVQYSPRRAKISRSISILHFLYLLTQGASLCSSSIELQDQIFGGMIFLWYIAKWACNLQIYSLRPDILIQALGTYEQDVHYDFLDNSVILVQTVLSHCGWVMMLFPPATLLTRPCKPGFLTSVLLGCNNGWWDTTYPLALPSLLIFESLFIVSTGFSMVFYLMVINLGVVASMGKYLRTIEDEKEREISHIEYRRLQVLNTAVEATIKESLFPTHLLFFLVLQIGSAVVTIRGHDILPLGLYAFFPYSVLLTTICVIALLVLAGAIYSKSSELIRRKRLGCGHNRRNIRLRVREVRSLIPMKTTFFENYIDSATPLVMENFAVTQAVALLLFVDELS